jgi:hypothetical protein
MKKQERMSTGQARGARQILVTHLLFVVGVSLTPLGEIILIVLMDRYLTGRGSGFSV